MSKGIGALPQRARGGVCLDTDTARSVTLASNCDFIFSSLISQPGAADNKSPLYKLYQTYRRVRSFGRGDMYMGYWDADSRAAKRISRDIEKEYYEKFKQKLPSLLPLLRLQFISMSAQIIC